MSRARVIPAVDHLLGLPTVQALATAHGMRRVRLALDAEVRRLRGALIAGRSEAATQEFASALLVERLEAALSGTMEPTLRPVINATGVVIHTNLGRAPLSTDALTAMRRVGAGYSTLEFDLETGERGSRHAHLDAALRDATGAPAGLATNNTAAGLTLALAALATGREVIISRGELVEIGGGFRVPDILRGSGALLREVGTTNRTRVADYAAAISDRTAAILRVHPSNFRMEGFTERPGVTELAELARRFSVPLIEDQGSGWLGLDLFAPDAFPAPARVLLAREPAVRDSVRAGADLVAFSGDKLLGGPQAGLLVGSTDVIAAIRRHPLMRAVRVDKVTYAGLEATLRAFTSGRAVTAVPVMQMLAVSDAVIAARADALVARLQAAGVACDSAPGESTVGGGSLPGETLPTCLVRIQASSADDLAAALRHGRTAVIARIAADRVCLDPRTVADDEDGPLARAVIDAYGA
jgi:L-seryl-tRNA(Ser) seleniumtransferase